MNIRTVQTYIKTHLIDMLSSMFEKVKWKGRFRIEKETDIWKPDTEELWKVKKGVIAETYSIFFDDEIICSFSEDDTKAEVDKKFLSGFLEAYQKERIYLNKALYVERDKREEQEKLVEIEAKKAQRKDDLKELSPEEKEIANIVLDEVSKEKGHETAT